MPALSETEIRNLLRELPHWTVRDSKLFRELKFKNFIEAFGFMTQVALLAERIDHHPEWSNVYNQVNIFLTTHSSKGISEKDFQLATLINQVLKEQ